MSTSWCNLGTWAWIPGYLGWRWKLLIYRLLVDGVWVWGMGVGVWVWEWGWLVWLFRGMDSERCERHTLMASTLVATFFL